MRSESTTRPARARRMPREHGSSASRCAGRQATEQAQRIHVDRDSTVREWALELDAHEPMSACSSRPDSVPRGAVLELRIKVAHVIRPAVHGTQNMP